MRTHNVGIQALVPLAQLQAILPAGLTAVANPVGSSTAQVVLTFVYQQRTEIVGQGTFGPASSLFVTTTVANDALGRQEGLQIAVYVNDQALVDALNVQFGPGALRLADVNLKFEQKNGSLNFDGTVNHPGTNFKIRASAECHEAIDTRVTNDPGPLAVRFLGDGPVINPSFRIANQLDNRVLPVATAQATITPTHGPLRLPAGNVTISSLGPSVIFARWIEIFSKRE